MTSRFDISVSGAVVVSVIYCFSALNQLCVLEELLNQDDQHIGVAGSIVNSPAVLIYE